MLCVLCSSTIAGGILFCHVVTPSAWQLPQYFDADWAPFAIILALGWTQVGRGGGGPYSACFCQALAHPAVACASVHCLPLSMCVQAHAMCSFWGPLVHAIKNSVTALDEKLRTHRLEIPYQQIGSSFPSSHFLHLSHFSYPTSHVFVSHLTLPISDLTLFPPPPLTLSQGHLISTICTHAPSTLLPSHASRYGPVTSFAISAGCFVGSFVSLGLATRFQV